MYAYDVMLFAIRTEASVLRMLDGSPQTGLHNPIVKYLTDPNVKINLGTPCREILSLLLTRYVAHSS
jgi:zeta-carotene desaturase